MSDTLLEALVDMRHYIKCGIEPPESCPACVRYDALQVEVIVALALYDHAVGPDFPPFDRLPADVQLYWLRQATAALAAAGVEEMVREAAIMGLQFGGEYLAGDSEVDAIVREVMGK